jgi:hypothetical protein
MKFEQIVDMVPVPTDKVIASGISFFIREQEPDNVEFERATNGYAIKVRTDDRSADEAKRFWEEEVDQKL